MSTIKPDYYIAHNGLPNIINEHRNRHKPSRIPTIEYKSNNSSSCRTLRNSKNEKDLINQRIAATRTTTTLSNCANIGDNNNRNKSSSNNNNYNVENYEKNYRSNNESTKCQRNPVTQQRRYDNTIFRHDLPDLIVLPPLPSLS